MATPDGSNSWSAGTTLSGLKLEQSSDQQQIITPATKTSKNNNRNKKRSQALITSSSSGAYENSSGISSGSGSGPTAARTPSTEESSDLQALLEQRWKRRKESNRESAKRSRMRKQLHLDGMAAQVANLRAENYKMLVMLERAAVGFLTVESENSMLGTQAMELQSRLRSLNEIIKCMHICPDAGTGDNGNTAFGFAFGLAGGN